MPRFSPNSPQLNRLLNPNPQPGEVLLDRDLRRGLHPSIPRLGGGTGRPSPGTGSNGGKTQGNPDGDGESRRDPPWPDSSRLSPDNAGDEEEEEEETTPGSLRLDSPLLKPWEGAKPRLRGASSGPARPPHAPSPPQRNKPPALRLCMVEKVFSSPKRTLPW